MDGRTIMVSISDHEQAFIDAQIASGRYANEHAVVHAGLAALEHGQRLDHLNREASDGDVIFLEAMKSLETTMVPPEIAGSVSSLKARLETSEASGISDRQIPEIMADVKAKLRGHGAV